MKSKILTKNDAINHNRRGAFWEDAPDFLLGKIAELSSVIAKHKNGDNQEALAFYDSILKAMRLAYTYMQDTKYIHHRNVLLESNIRFLAQYNKEIEEQLIEYKTVTKLKMQGRLDEVIEECEQFTQRVLSLKSDQSD